MKKILFCAFAGISLLLSSCAQPDAQPAEGSTVGFALSFFKSVDACTPEGANLVVSPYSAGVVFSMLEEGAEGETKAEFDDALNGCLFKAQDLGSNGDVVVKSANSAWVSDDFSRNARECTGSQLFMWLRRRVPRAGRYILRMSG